MKIKNLIINSIIPIFLMLLFIKGCTHAQKKHNVADVFSDNFFVCWYYGVESFWHSSDQTELNENVKAGIYILMKYPNGIDPTEQLEFNNNKSKFKDLLQKYDKQEIRYIANGTMAYLNFKNEFERESLNSILTAKEKGIFEFNLTPKMDSLLSILSKYGLDEELKDMVTEVKKISEACNRKLKEDPNFITEYMKQTNDGKLFVDQYIGNRLKIYNELFN